MLANNKLYLCSNEATTFDPYYRYRVDPPIYEIHNKKGTDVTCFTNSISFAKSIQFDHNTLIRAIGTELSCKSTINDNYATFQGIHDRTKINNIICNIIQDYLLCQLCDRPEVILYKKKHKLKQACRACGEKNYIKPALEYTDIYEIINKSIK